ncbi:MAG: hypothetical protein IT567_04635 [Alphaproteobacteria bacterium]|nr:hypothetical protein [Alphaproteobacteria bacterium]
MPAFRSILPVTALTALFMLSACSITKEDSCNAERYGTIYTHDKTIKAGAGTKGVLGGIKSRLAAEGWMFYIPSAPVQTRYTLAVEEHATRDACPSAEFGTVHNVSLIDNVTGQEIILMSGRGCVSTAVEQFMQRMHNQ